MEQDKIWDYYQNQEDANQYFSEARQRYMLRHIQSGMAVLNIGVGGGAFERLALARSIDVHALDPSEKAIERLRQDLGIGEKAKAGYSQAMPFRDGSFDVVVMSEVLEHLDNAVLDESLDEVLRVLKPGGFLLASTPYRENLVDNTVVCPSCTEVFHRYGHVQVFDKPRMQRLLMDHSFKVEKIWISTFVDWERKGLKNKLKSLLRVLLARMGEGIGDPHLLLIARKRL